MSRIYSHRNFGFRRKLHCELENSSRREKAAHADRLGRNPGVNSWNAIHVSQGCGLEQLAPTGGAGLFYCFATN